MIGVAAPHFTGVDINAVDVWLPANVYSGSPGSHGEPWYETFHSSVSILAGVPPGFAEARLTGPATTALRSVHLSGFYYDSTQSAGHGSYRPSTRPGDSLAGAIDLDSARRRCADRSAHRLRKYREPAARARNTTAQGDRASPRPRIIHLVIYNLTIHCKKSLTDAFREREGHRLWHRVAVHFTPKHGSWLSQAEIELSLVSRACLGHRRLDTLALLRTEIRAWTTRADRTRTKIHWRFTRADARRKFGYQTQPFTRSQT